MKNKRSLTVYRREDGVKSAFLFSGRIKLLSLVLLIGLIACNQEGNKRIQVLENDQVKMVFCSEPVPFMKELILKSSGKNFIADTTLRNMFTLDLLPAEGDRISVGSKDARDGSVRITKAGNLQQISVSFKGLGPSGDISVTITGRLMEDKPFATWSMKIDNPGKLKIATGRFPEVSAVPAFGSPDDDFIVGPALPGVMIENPAKNWKDDYSLAWTFPGDQSAQFFSYQDADGGIYMASMDTSGYNRVLRISKNGNQRYVLSQEYRIPEMVAPMWETPYEVVLGVTSGTWQQTADIYKEWAVQQRWCEKTLAQRDDIAGFWKEGPCIHTCELRTYDGKSRLINGSYYPELLPHMIKVREMVDGPVLPMLPGWENHRRWTAGEYFPVFDHENAKTTLDLLRKENFHPFFFLSGMYYTFRNEGRDSSRVNGWENYTGSFVVGNDGKYKVSVLDESSRESVWKRHSYEFCPAAKQTKEFFRSVIDNAHALGVDVIQMDQTVRGAGDVCYSKEHGHLPGLGPYQSQSFHELLDDMHRYGKTISPGFILMHEEPHEDLIPYLDGIHTREFSERWWYRGAPGARGIPLFSYLYHEYIICYGGEGVSVSKDKSQKLVRDHAVNLVTGKTPGVSVWGNQKAIFEIHTDQLAMLRNHSRLLKTEAQKFLMLGKMLHPLDFNVPSVDLRIARRGARDRREPEPFLQNAVLTSSWQSPEGLTGHCLVNITDEKQQVDLQLDTRNAPGWPKADIDLYRAGNYQECENLFKGTTLPKNYLMELAPLEAVFIVMRPSK